MGLTNHKHYSKTLRYLLLTCLFFVVPNIYAQDLIAPKELVQFGKIYRLAFQSKTPNVSSVNEYTTDNESINNWTRLVTINFNKSPNYSLLDFLTSHQKILKAYRPEPHFSLYVKNGYAYSQIIFEPEKNNLFYELNIQKAVYYKKCGGMVSFQYAIKIPSENPKNHEEHQLFLKELLKRTNEMSDEMQSSDWMPMCVES